METWKSPITYHGCKYKTIKNIIRLLPPDIKIFHDLFGGSGTVAFNMLLRADSVIYNDLDWNLYNALKFLSSPKNKKLIEMIKEIIEKYNLIASSEKINIVRFNRFRNWLNDHVFPYTIPATEMGSDYYANQKQAAYYLVMKLFAFHGNIAWSKDGKIAVTYGYDSGDSFNTFLIKLKSVLLLPVGNLKYRCLSFIDAIKDARAGDYVYLDPPYYKTEVDYLHTWTDEMDDELFKALDDLNERGINWGLSNTFVHISGEHNEKLKEWANKYYIHRFNLSYNAFGNVNTKNQEVFITNYKTPEPPAQLQLF